MSDYIFLLENRLRRDQLQLLVQVQHAAERGQVHLFLAGGAVRDLLSGVQPRDLDFCAEGPALKLVRLLDSRLFTVLSTDEERQSAELLFGGSATAEIAMCRKEVYTKTGGQPEIARATIQDDLRRRDFSINAIAISLNPASRGLLLDPSNGLADIERKELRTLSNYSFYDEPIRLLRLVRFETRLKYMVEEKTRTQFNSAREAGVEEHISPHARLTELRQIAMERHSAEAVKALDAAGLLTVFEPHLQGKKVDLPLLARLDKLRGIVEDSGLWVDSFGPFLWSLTHKLTPAERNALRTRTGMKAAEAAAWTELENRAKALQKLLSGKQATPNARLYKLLSTQDPAVALFLWAFSPLQPVRERVKNYFTWLLPVARGITEQEVADATGVKCESPKFAAAWENYLAARFEKKPAKPEAPKPASTQ